METEMGYLRVSAAFHRTESHTNIISNSVTSTNNISICISKCDAKSQPYCKTITLPDGISGTDH
jgi:hypothetical protein